MVADAPEETWSSQFKDRVVLKGSNPRFIPEAPTTWTGPSGYPLL